MTSKRITKGLATELGISQVAAKEFLDGLEAVLKREMNEMPVDDKFKCLDITFRKVKIKERMGRNPLTGEPKLVPEHGRVVLKQSVTQKMLAKELNNDIDRF